MTNHRTHYATTSDGVTLGATVHGQGPPLVFLQGAVGDGDLDWQAVLPYLTDRFTCHLPSMRCRGLSGDHPDLSIPRLAEDVITYVDSIGEPTGLVGWSLGASLALLAAAQSSVAVAIAPFEPAMMNLMDEREEAVMGGAVASMGEQAQAGDLKAAVRAFLGWPFTEAEIAMADRAGYTDAAGRYAPSLLEFFRQATESDSPEVDEAAVLAAISVPVLALKGSDTRPFFADSVRYVGDHAPDARVHDIPGAAHAAPMTHPDALAEALTEFFASTLQHA
jgi:pimeloyl-ACP methyl ester carboxylesterase